MYLTDLKISFNEYDLDSIRSYILKFHSKIRDELICNYHPGNMKNKPKLGYYISLFEKTHLSRKVSSWEKFESKCLNTFEVNTIKMKIDENMHQNLYIINPILRFETVFFDMLDSLLTNIPCKFQKESTSICVQEFGYSMKFHTDAGVKSRIHINLNRNSFDYFYTEQGSYKIDFGKCYLFEASKTNHSFMAFQKEPRIHLILDII